MSKFDPFAVSLEGVHLAEASAGTGKTYNITSLFIRGIIEERAEIDEILILTYTNAAADELRERVLRRLRESIDLLRGGEPPEKDEFLDQLTDNIEDPEKALENLEKALRNFDEASIFTIHGFCQRALLEQSFLSGISFGGELIGDDSDFVHEAVEDYWRKLVGTADEDELERVWLNILRRAGYLPDRLAQTVMEGIGKPYLEITPDITSESSRNEDLNELLQVYNKLKTLWADSKREIRKILLSDAMNGNRYRSSSVPNWIEQLEVWLQDELPSLTFFDKLDRFSISFIREYGVKAGREVPEHPFFQTVDDYLARAERVKPHLTEFKKQLLEEVRAATLDKKITRGILGYDDLLIFLNNALKRSPDGEKLAAYLRTRYPVALVDEFQDTDPVQYEILTSIYVNSAGGPALFLIGDPKQSIYSFRGADVFSYLKARSNVIGENRYGLSRNFRSERHLIEAINSLFGRLEKPFLFEEILFDPAVPGDSDIEPLMLGGNSPPPICFLNSSSMNHAEQLRKSDCSRRAAEVTAESIAGLLNRGSEGTARIGGQPVSAKEIAVLVRTHNQAGLIQEALARRDVKSVQYSQQSVFDTEEVRDMISLLKAMAEPRNESYIRVVLASDLFPHTAADLVRLHENEQQWYETIGFFGELGILWYEHGFAKAFKAFLNKTKAESQIIRSKNGERKLTNFLQLGELLQVYERERNPGPRELIRWLIQKSREPDGGRDEEQLRLESDVDLVKIVTMHRSKGLEYPITYCPFLWDGSTFRNKQEPFLYHNPRKGYQPSLEYGEKGSSERDLHRYWSAMEEMSENMRLAYVALTRSKQRCYIVFEPSSGMEYSALGYLLLGSGHVEEQIKENIISEGSKSSLPVKTFYAELVNLVEANRPLMGREQLNEHELTKIRPGMETGKQVRTHRSFTRQEDILPRNFISSFSSIMNSIHTGDGEEDFSSDEIFFPGEPEIVPADADHSIFSFPRGPKAGNCVHKIFEDIHFNHRPGLRDVIIKNLERFGFDTEWSPVLEKMVSGVLNRDLRGGVKLADIESSDMVKEMEFHFDLHPFVRGNMIEIIRGGTPDTGKILNIPGGFMRGYIDLVFRYGDKYYIADYKTNHLGDRPEDYSLNNMKEEIIAAGYDVQYHIYMLALHRFLKGRLKGYSYTDHLGGVFYLFVRGIGHGKDDRGIFFDSPDKTIIDKLDRLFSEGAGL